MSNGDRSSQIDKNSTTTHKHMIPVDVLSKIRAVTIHYGITNPYQHIRGFTFLDKDNVKLWKIGVTS